MIKDKMLKNVFVCEELLKDIEGELQKIFTNKITNHVNYSNCTKERVSRSAIIIGEKLREIDKMVKAEKQED